MYILPTIPKFTTLGLPKLVYRLWIYVNIYDYMHIWIYVGNISTTIYQKGLWRHNSEKVNCSGEAKNCFHIKILGLQLWNEMYIFIRLRYNKWRKNGEKTFFYCFFSGYTLMTLKSVRATILRALLTRRYSIYRPFWLADVTWENT